MLKLTRWTIAHRLFVVAAWVVLAVGVRAVSQTIGKRNANNFSLPNTGSQHAIDLLQSHFPAKAGDVDQIVFRDRTGKLDDHSARAVIVPLLERIALRGFKTTVPPGKRVIPGTNQGFETPHGKTSVQTWKGV